MSLLPLDEAQARLLALAEPLGRETIEIVDAAGRWLANDVIALRSQPAADLSAMDGYALRSRDLRPEAIFRLIGESAAGRPFEGAVGDGEAVRIFTGAIVPAGADMVAMQEDCTRDGDQLIIDVPPAPLRHIRRCGNDFREGDVLAKAGEKLTPGRLALAIMAGHGMVHVRRRARVALISTGDELVPPGGALAHGQIPASNGPMLRAQLQRAGAIVDDLGIFADDLDTIAQAICSAAHYDVIITIGGASVGDLDLVRPALAAAGATLDFLKVALKPGKPLMAGRLGDAVVLGLPGNPVSAFVTATLFAMPLLRRLMGSATPLPQLETHRLAAPMEATGSRTEFVRARLIDAGVLPLQNQDSAALHALASADALIMRPAGSGTAVEGDMVNIVRID